MHYENSAIVDMRHQSLAPELIIGERVPPETIVRAADGRPYNIQDLLPSDTRFKVLVFTGDSSDPSQLARVEQLADSIEGSSSFLTKAASKSMFDFIAISSTDKKRIVYNTIPALFRSHWSK